MASKDDWYASERLGQRPILRVLILVAVALAVIGVVRARVRAAR